MRLTATQKAYIAGFLDADGSISIYGRITKKGWHHWSLDLSFYNCNLEVLKKIQNWTGAGYILTRNRNSKWNISRNLRISSKPAVDILKQIKSYLIVKKKQAGIAIEFSKTFSRKNIKGRNLKQKTVEKREELKKKLQELTLIANYHGENTARIN